MSASHSLSSRSTKLNKFLDAAVHGKQQVTKQTYKLFIESICVQPDAAACADKLLSSPQGLTCLHASMHFDLSPEFFSGPADSFLRYLSCAEVESAVGGEHLERILLAVTKPRFWHKFKEHFLNHELPKSALQSFTWLLHHLVQLPGDASGSYCEDARNSKILDPLLNSLAHPIRVTAQRIQHLTSISSEHESPGGRHTNDFADFRSINIHPTPDEFASARPPYLPTQSAVEASDPSSSRTESHLDGQFRLLREDMLLGVRGELQVPQRAQNWSDLGASSDGLRFIGVYHGSNEEPRRWGVSLRCEDDFWRLREVVPEARKEHLRRILKHGCMTCLILDGHFAAFPLLHLDEELLLQDPPIIVLQLDDSKSASTVLSGLTDAKRIELLPLHDTLFAHGPVLSALKQISLPYPFPELFLETTRPDTRQSRCPPAHLIDKVASSCHHDLQSLLQTPQSVILDKAQTDAFVNGLSHRVSLIQGPPGTGRSFIGALLAKTFHDHDASSRTILVVCHTDQGLDHFLEDLLDVGVPSANIVRLGDTTNPRTKNLSLPRLRAKKKNHPKLKKADWEKINFLESKALAKRDDLDQLVDRYCDYQPQLQEILEYLEFEDHEFFSAFDVPKNKDGRRVKTLSPFYLYQRWKEGRDAGVLDGYDSEFSAIWHMSSKERQEKCTRWREGMLKELIESICAVGAEYNETLETIEQVSKGKGSTVPRGKKILGCVATMVGKHHDYIQAANPRVVVVEDAGRILESHILVTLSPKTEQLILIGDHRQLRPRINNPSLTVEKGDGYDLDRSLFERLILKGYTHTTLTEQHRMRPEISELARHVAYPEMKDSPDTLNRSNLRGVRDNVVFINHKEEEKDDPEIEEQRDLSVKASKRNEFEVAMVVRIIRYLTQQGYETDKIVVLVPYLAQLRDLRDALKDENGSMINDLDSYDLIRARVPPVANGSKKSIRVATIDADI